MDPSKLAAILDVLRERSVVQAEFTPDGALSKVTFGAELIVRETSSADDGQSFEEELPELAYDPIAERKKRAKSS